MSHKKCKYTKQNYTEIIPRLLYKSLFYTQSIKSNMKALKRAYTRDFYMEKRSASFHISIDSNKNFCKSNLGKKQSWDALSFERGSKANKKWNKVSNSKSLLFQTISYRKLCVCRVFAVIRKRERDP